MERSVARKTGSGEGVRETGLEESTAEIIDSLI